MCAELLQRDIDDVQFHFATREQAFTGCAKLKQMHDTWYRHAPFVANSGSFSRVVGHPVGSTSFTEWYKAHYIGKTGVGLELCDKQSALYNKCLKVSLDWAFFTFRARCDSQTFGFCSSFVSTLHAQAKLAALDLEHLSQRSSAPPSTHGKPTEQ